MGERKPALRFKGFEGEWDTCRLGDIADLLTGYSFESKHFTEEGIPLVRGMNVKRGYLDMSHGICEYWSSCSGLETYLLRENDIVIQMDGALIGKSYALVSKENVPSLLVQRVTRVRCPKHHFQYVYQIIQRDFLKYIKGNKTETAVPHLSLNDIKKFELALISIEEQTQIGTFFKNLDTLITQQQRKYDSLLNVKKSMLEKMFPKDGADVPEIRFKGFEGKWERWQISNIAKNTYGGGTPSTSNEELWVGDIPWIQSSDLKEGKVFDVIPHKFLSKNAFNLSATKLIPENSIAIITRVGVGKLALIPFSYATSQDFLSLSNTNKNEWFTVYALYNKLKSEANLVQGTSIKGITKEDFLSKEISVPCHDEEAIKIGNYFKHLDTLLTQHQKKLDHLKHIKSALLEKMFVSEAA